MKIKRLLMLLIMAVGSVTGAIAAHAVTDVEESVFALDVEAPEGIDARLNGFILELKNGLNTFTYEEGDELKVSANEGWIIEDVTGGLQFSMWTDSYYYEFTEEGKRLEFKIVCIQESVYEPSMATFTININHANSLKGCFFNSEDHPLELKDGSNEFSFDPEEDNYLILLFYAGTDPMLTVDGEQMFVQEKAIIYLTDGKVINIILKEMEDIGNTFTLAIDDPNSIEARLDGTLLNLSEGDNKYDYEEGDVLTVAVNDGWELTGPINGMNFNVFEEYFYYEFTELDGPHRFVVSTDKANGLVNVDSGSGITIMEGVILNPMEVDASVVDHNGRVLVRSRQQVMDIRTLTKGIYIIRLEGHAPVKVCI